MKEDDQAPGSRVGRGMLTVMWVMLLGGLTLYFAKREDNQYNPNSNVAGLSQGGNRSIVLKQNDWGHYVASGYINGRPVTFLLDTGATAVAVPQHLARELGLKAGPRYTVTTANGDIEVRGTRLQKLELGNIIFYDVPAAINPGMDDDEILLGMSALKHVDFTQSGNELTITQYGTP